jgi:hypothetical protein
MVVRRHLRRGVKRPRLRIKRAGSSACGAAQGDYLWSEDLRLLTENQISRSWRKLFAGSELSQELLVKAEALLEELRPESPLRHRLAGELRELRKLKPQKQS